MSYTGLIITYLPSNHGQWRITMARRGENIYKRSDGRWEGRYIKSRDISGKAVYKSVYAHSYTEVKEKLRSCQESYKKQSCIDDGYEFEFFADCWLNTVKMKCKISTYNKYKNLYNNYIDPVFHDCKINDIDMAMIQQITQINNRLSPKTQNDILCVIRQIFNYAEANGYRRSINLNNLSVHQENSDMRVLSCEEQSIFTKYLLERPDLCKIGIYLCLYTGMRIGELCALRFDDISLEMQTISIRKTMQRVQINGKSKKTEVIITAPKSRKSIRDIPLPSPLIEVISKWYSSMKPTDYVLTGKSDKFIEPRLLEYRFKQYIKSCGLENVNFHALRHSFATRCVEAGFDIKTLSEILGHVNVNITLNRYVHSSMDLKKSNMDKLCHIM